MTGRRSDLRSVRVATAGIEAQLRNLRTLVADVLTAVAALNEALDGFEEESPES
jgi:hypothetical protein